jgi:copper chaperone
MPEIKFKSNINCNNCIGKVTPVLNKFINLEWNVDIASPGKILTLKGDFNIEEIKESLKSIGFKTQEIE